jgi:predicted transcriptional regulator
LETDQLPKLINGIDQTLARGHTVIGPVTAKPVVSTEKSLFPEHIVCLNCGQRFQIVRRHFAAEHGLTPDQYRAEWGLAHNYPMVSTKYAAQQSRFAKGRLLGRNHGPIYRQT